MLVSKSTEKIVLTALGLGVVVVVYGAYKTSAAIKQNVHLINPASDKNIVNQGVSKIVSSATGGKSKSLGSFIYCVLNPRSLICDDKRRALSSVMDVSNLSEQQVNILYDQQKEFLTNQDVKQ